MFIKFLQTHLAKSDGTTLQEHINDLYIQLDIFLKNYPDMLNEKEIKLLKYAIEFHDYGKLNRLFQCKLPVREKTVKCKTGEKDDITPHQYLSPLFLRFIKENLSEEDWIILIYSIINHHARGREKYLNSYGIEILFEEIEENIENFFGHIGITSLSEQTKEFYRKYLEKITKSIANIETLNKKFNEDTNFIKSLIKIAGLLIRIDHSASGDDLTIEQEPIEEDRETLFKNYLKSENKQPELRPFQQKFKDFENLVLVADTGLGKTGLAVLWSKRKMFYVLPNRASTNAMFNTMGKIFGKDNVGLLHSSSLFHVYENTEKEDYTVLRDFENTKNLSKPVTVSTADQLFTAVFKYPTYEKIYATLSYSDIVVDEIQGFDPAQIVPILKQIEETKQIGARYLIITATLPEIVKEKFEKIGFTIKTNNPDTIDKTKRHKIKIIDDNIFSIKNQAVNLAKSGKNILIIVNTVSTSQELYREIKKLYKNTDLLHSRFIWKTRKEKEDQIKEDYKNKKGKIWITTQLVEASLDIDFDVLFTEVSPADSLIQRMGRIWRHKNFDYSLKEPNIYILTEVDEKKVSKVYEKALREESIKLIKHFLDKDNFLDSTSKRKIVETLYSRETLERLNSNYFERWKQAENVLKSNWDYLFKSEAQQIFRDIFTFEAIPYTFREEAVNLVNQLKSLKEIKDKKERKLKRIQILKRLNDIKLPVPVYWVLNKNVKSKSPYEILDKNYDIFVLAEYFTYDNEIGLTFDRKILEKYEINEEMFL